MCFGAIANSARGGPQRPPPMGDRVKQVRIVYLPINNKYHAGNNS